MVTRDEIAAKTDEELVDVYANQSDYLPEVVEMVADELKRRGVGTDEIVVIDPAPESAEVEVDERWVQRRMRKIGYVVVLIGGALAALAMNNVSSETPANLPVIAFGSLFLVLGVLSIMRKAWAFVASSVTILLCLLIAMFNVATGSEELSPASIIFLAVLIVVAWQCLHTTVAVVRFRRQRKLTK
jgi:hypothetical protein